jgi:hypothetical protein
MILRRSVILALGSMPLLARGVFSQGTVKPRRVGLLSSAAPLTDTSDLVIGLSAGFSKRGYIVGRSLLYRALLHELAFLNHIVASSCFGDQVLN